MKKLHGFKIHSWSLDEELICLFDSEDSEFIAEARQMIEEAEETKPDHFVGFKVIENLDDLRQILQEREDRWK